MPDIALKHFDLARQFAPRTGTSSNCRWLRRWPSRGRMTEQSAHSGLDEAAPLEAGGRRGPAQDDQAGECDRHTDPFGRDGGRNGAQTGGLSQDRRREAGGWGAGGRFPCAADPGAGAGLPTPISRVRRRRSEAQRAGAPKEELQAYYAQLGLTAFDHGRYEESLAAFLRLRDLGPEAVEGWFNCGLVCQKMGRLDEALTFYQEAVRIAPDNPKTWCNLSAVWFERGDHAEAERAARRSLELKVDYARAWDNLASALSAMNRLDEASDACQQAIRIQPALHSAWFKFGVVNFQLDNMVMATEAFHMARDNPDFASYVLYYAAMIEAAGANSIWRWRSWPRPGRPIRQRTRIGRGQGNRRRLQQGGKSHHRRRFLRPDHPEISRRFLRLACARDGAPSGGTDRPRARKPISAPRNCGRKIRCRGITSACSPPTRDGTRRRGIFSSAKWSWRPTTRRRGTITASPCRRSAWRPKA